MEAIVFWIFSILAMFGGLMLVLHKNPINSALSLILTLFSTASLFVLLNAGFIAVMQILVYAGAIMVLFVFVIMMLNLQGERLGMRRHKIRKGLGLFVIIAIGLKFAQVLATSSIDKATLPEGFGSVENVGMQIFVQNVLPFEAIGILLLAAVVGAVMVAKTKV